MRVIHNSHTRRSPAAVEPALGWLEVRRGGTHFPRRPISSARFLIGAGTNCHLQLGGDIPMLHSLLTYGAQGWTIEAIAPEPALIVNGTVCRHWQLSSADIVEVGPFRFCIATRSAGAGRSPRHDTSLTAAG